MTWYDYLLFQRSCYLLTHFHQLAHVNPVAPFHGRNSISDLNCVAHAAAAPGLLWQRQDDGGSSVLLWAVVERKGHLRWALGWMWIFSSNMIYTVDISILSTVKFTCFFWRCFSAVLVGFLPLSFIGLGLKVVGGEWGWDPLVSFAAKVVALTRWWVQSHHEITQISWDFLWWILFSHEILGQLRRWNWPNRCSLTVYDVTNVSTSPLLYHEVSFSPFGTTWHFENESFTYHHEWWASSS